MAYGYYPDRAPGNGRPLAVFARRGREPRGVRLYPTRGAAVRAAARRWRCAGVSDALAIAALWDEVDQEG